VRAREVGRIEILLDRAERTAQEMRLAL